MEKIKQWILALYNIGKIIHEFNPQLIITISILDWMVIPVVHAKEGVFWFDWLFFSIIYYHN